MHKQIAEASSNKRASAVAWHNEKTSIRPINFTEDDYVLRETIQGNTGMKPSLKWYGPFRIFECRSTYIFRIEYLLTGIKEEVHGRRLRFFRNSAFDVTEELRQHLANQKDELFVIEEFNAIRRRGTKFELRVKWRGFPDN